MLSHLYLGKSCVKIAMRFLSMAIVFACVFLCSNTVSHAENLGESLQVTQKWVDGEGSLIEAPTDSLEVELYQDGVGTGITKNISKENNWTVEFKDLNTDGDYSARIVGEASANLDGIEINMIDFETGVFEINYSGNKADGINISIEEQILTMPDESQAFEEAPNELKESGNSNMPTERKSSKGLIVKILCGGGLLAGIFVLKKKIIA